MNVGNYFQSISLEMRAVQNRVRNFIERAHWQTDGEWKESVLRYFLKRNLPKSVDVGRGFVITENGPSRQIDVLVYRTDIPVLFSDGNVVFITPDAVLAVIEVKSRVDSHGLRKSIEKLSRQAAFLGNRGRSTQLFGLFAFESDVNSEAALEICKQASRGNLRRVVDLVCLGDSHLIKWWPITPTKPIFSHNM